MRLGNTKFNQTISFFYSRYKEPISITGIYQGSSAFLFCNGNSIKNIDISKLKIPCLPIMAMNNGATTLLVNNIAPSFWCCVDPLDKFVKQIWLNPLIKKFIPFDYFNERLWDNEEWKEMDIRACDCPNVHGFYLNKRFVGRRFWTENTFNWGWSDKKGGGRSVMLPAMKILYVLGFRTIYLLGADMHMDEQNKYHFSEERSTWSCGDNNKTYQRWIKDYAPMLEKYSERVGLKVYNCNDKSNLKSFEFKSFDDAISDVKKSYAPFDSIKTAGMYAVKENKQSHTQQECIQLLKEHGNA